jgi:hypothetical protein
MVLPNKEAWPKMGSIQLKHPLTSFATQTGHATETMIENAATWLIQLPKAINKISHLRSRNKHRDIKRAARQEDPIQEQVHNRKTAPLELVLPKEKHVFVAETAGKSVIVKEAKKGDGNYPWSNPHFARVAPWQHSKPGDCLSDLAQTKKGTRCDEKAKNQIKRERLVRDRDVRRGLLNDRG